MSTLEHISITSGPSNNQSENFDFLREEGIAYLQKVVGKIWTDFNVHDPGVTILEQLCYAITDLGYRANLDIQDLLAINPDDPTEKELNNFLTAREILMNAPFTINDFRKLLIDQEGIKNAWLEKSTVSEVAFYADLKNKKMTYDPGTDNIKVDLNGLYEVLIEFDRDEIYGDLNDNTIELEYEIDFGALKGLVVEISVEFPYWDKPLPDNGSWSDLEDVKESIIKIEVNVENEIEGYVIDLSTNNDNKVLVNVVKTTGTSYTPDADLSKKVGDRLNDILDPSKPGDQNLLIIQQEKINKTLEIIDRVKKVLHANRNLCEDFIRFKSLNVEEIVVCADIEIKSESNSALVMAEVYDQIGRFIAPDIHFYSFAEMLEKDYKTEEIFQGPRLSNGFIDTVELENSSRKKRIHVSDLINIIMDIEGVIAIKEIKIGNIPLGDSSVLSKSVKWCLELAWDKYFVPRLSREKSKIILYKKGIPFIPNEDEVEEILNTKNAEYAVNRIPEGPHNLPIPNGKRYDLDAYTSIQEGFPQNYGIGAVGLPDSASDLRKAQAHQLKAYLLFFDQFLANYCSQLEHLKELFSMNGDIDKTYFHQSLLDISNVAYLYKDFVDGAGLSSDPKRDQSDEFAKAWTFYKAADRGEKLTGSESYDFPRHHEILGEIIEDSDTFHTRRNQFLDHLLARFAEQFTDYAMLVYKMNGSNVADELIEDKLQFIQEYPALSYNRGQAFDYLKTGWNNDNVSGLEKRVARLLGIDDYSRRNLGCPSPIKFFKKYKDTKGKWRFNVKNTKGDIVLKSEAYNSTSARTTGIESVLDNGKSKDNYEPLVAMDDTFYFNLIAQNNKVIGTSNMYATEKERDEAIEELIILLNGECSGEGLYLLEHLLLRPRNFQKDVFLPVSFQQECYCPGFEDAYSFRATCILPAWIGRFKNVDYRNFVEQTIHMETPAHIYMKICWINQEQMNLFQKAYQAWLIEMQKCPADQEQLTIKQNNLISALNQLRNVYPVSTLYDCQEPAENPVMLGQSILGTFTPKENE